jgi:hypothetical protein
LVGKWSAIHGPRPGLLTARCRAVLEPQGVDHGHAPRSALRAPPARRTCDAALNRQRGLRDKPQPRSSRAHLGGFHVRVVRQG